MPAVLPLPTYVAPDVSSAVWRFAVGPGASTGEARPLRELSQAFGRHIMWRLDGHEVAQFSIDGRSEEAAEIGRLLREMDPPPPPGGPTETDLWVWRDGVKMLLSRITVPVHELDADRHRLQFTAIGYRGMMSAATLADTLEDRTWVGVDQAQIAWEMLAEAQSDPGGDWGITQGLSPAGQPRNRTDYPAGKNLLEAVSELGRVENGFEWEISPDMEMNVWSPRRGSDKGVVLDYGGSVTALSMAGDPSRFGNTVLLTGSEDTTPVRVSHPDIASDPRGRWSLVESHPSVEDQQNLIDRAPATLDAAFQFSSPWTVTLAPQRWEGRDHLWLGDIARLRVGSGALGSYTVRVAEISVTCGDDGTETIRMGLLPEVT